MASRRLKPPPGADIIVATGRPTPSTVPSGLPRPSAGRLKPTVAVDFSTGGGGGGGGGDKEDKGILGGILSIPSSAGRALAESIKAIPTFVGKAGQEAVGWAEEGFNVVTDVFDEDLYTSRMETDYQRGKELGLEGDELWAYATQRTMPLSTPMLQSMRGTAERVSELGSFGLIETGEPGTDYYNALRRGDLGATLVEDVGNVILAGRLTGAGNVAVRGGEAVAAAGSPRAGAAISTAGRFIEEPIGTTVRGVTGAAARGISTTGRVGALQDPFERISLAERPLRQAYTEISDARRARAGARVEKLTVDINNLEVQKNAAQQAGNQELASNLQADINALKTRRKVAVEGTGAMRTVRRITKKGKIAEERMVQTVVAQLRRLQERGPAPESVATYRKRANDLRQQAEQATDAAQRDTLLARADATDNLANVKEQFPELTSGNQPDWVFEAVVHYLSGKARELAADEANGTPMADLIAAATDPYIDPSIAERGMLPTEDGVRAAIELVKYVDGRPNNLNPAEVLSMNAFMMLLTELSRVVETNMRAGIGMPEGPAPFYWFQTYPIPQNLLQALQTMNNETRANVIGQLDRATGQVIRDLYAQGLLDADFFDDYGIKLDEFNENGFQVGLFESLVKEGLQELQAGTGKPVPYMIAFTALQFSYKRLQQIAPQLMLNPDIYPAIMRPAIITRRQRIRQVTGTEVLGLADQLANIARDNPELISQSMLDAITRDIRAAVNPQLRGEQTTLRRLLNRINKINELALNRLEELRKKADQLTTEERTLATQLIETNQSLGAVQATLRTMAAQRPEPSPRLRAAEAKVRDLEDERVVLLQERATLNEQLDAERQEQTPRLQQITDELSTLDQRIKKLTDEQTKLDRQVEAHQRETKIIQDALQRAPQFTDPETILPLMEDYNQILEFSESGPPEPVRVTDQQVREAKRKAVEEAVGDVPLANLYADFDSLLGARKLKARARQKPDGSMEEMGLLDEDYIDYVRRSLPNTKQRPWFKEFVDEYTAADGEPLDAAVEQAAASYFGEIEQLSQTGETGSRTAREFASIEDWLDTLARAYRRIKEAEERVKKAERRPLREYREDLELEQVGVLGEDSGFSRQSKTGLDIDDVRETALIIINGEAQALARIEENARKYDADNAARRSAEITEELRQARTRRGEVRNQPQITYDTAVLRRTGEINRRLTQIDRQLGRVVKGRQKLGPARRSLQFARQAEPRESARLQARAERAQLRGVGRIRRPAPGAEGPAVGELTAGATRFANASMAQLNKRQQVIVSRLKQTRRNMADQDALAAQATPPNVLTSRVMREESDFGPALLAEGQQPIYLPAGPTRSMMPGERFEMVMRGEGAAPQTRLQAAKQRTTGAMVLSASAMAERISEVLGQQYRNTVIEEILRDPTVTSNVQTILGTERVAQLLAESEQAVQAQNIPRNTAEFNQAVQRDFGTKVILELQARGYEAVSPVRINPETLAHAPVGDLTIQVMSNNIDANTLVMRQGLREIIVTQYERAGAREVPGRINRILSGLGNLTGRWKSHILPISLRWQIGDAVGIVMFAWLRGDIPPQQLASRMRDVIRLMKDPNDPRARHIFFGDVLGNPFSDPVLASLFATGLAGRGLKMEETLFSEQMSARITGQGRLGSERAIARPYNAFRAKGFRLNEAINSIGRAAVAIENLDRILREQGRSLDEITGPDSIGDPVIAKAINDAVDITNETLGAFSDLTPFEKQVMRNVFPFWSWLKFINKAAFELAIDNPDRVLFYAHLGSLASDPDDPGLADWLRGKTPIGGYLFDLSFLNPYSDALIFSGNPFVEAVETFTGVSPAITTPLAVGGEVTYGLTGRRFPFLNVVSRPSYLEGRPESNVTRSLGDTLGGAAYLGIRGLVPIARNVFDVLPTGTIPGTDIATGPVQRFGQGSLRTTGAYATPRLSPTLGRVGALLRTFGVPAPLISQELADQQARDQAQRDAAAAQRRIEERARAGG